MITLNSNSKILCHYTNLTAQFQIIRVSNIPDCFFERTVIPRGSIIFEALPEAQLEVHTGDMASSILSDVIPCSQLAQVGDKSIRQQSSLFKKLKKFA